MSDTLPCDFEDESGRLTALVVLQTDVTIEQDMRRLLPAGQRLFVTRVPNAPQVTRETLGAMEGEIARACSLLPPGDYRAVGYGCTSASSVIGSDRVAELVRAGCSAATVWDPLSSLIAACRARGIGRLGLVSPYVEAVSRGLVERLEAAGIAVPHFASFEVGDDAQVARIAPSSIERAGREMARRDVDAVFLSCTNLRTLDVIDRMIDCEMPIWSSNLLLARAMTDDPPFATNESLTVGD